MNMFKEMYLLVLAHPGCPGHSPESHKMVVICLKDSMSYAILVSMLELFVLSSYESPNCETIMNKLV